MKSATGNLEGDHVHILKLTEVMNYLVRTGSRDADQFDDIIDIIRSFADGLHHAKEETLLFPALETRGFSSESGPVAVMLNEHDQGRAFVRGIAENLKLFRNGDQTAIYAIHENMKGYSGLLANHIMKENNILFRLADGLLSDTEQDSLLTEFEILDRNRQDGMRSNDYINRINALALNYNL